MLQRVEDSVRRNFQVNAHLARNLGTEVGDEEFLAAITPPSLAMAKRKRGSAPAPTATPSIPATATKPASSPANPALPKPVVPSLLPQQPSTADPSSIHLQVVTGSYEKALHGFIITIPAEPSNDSNADSTALTASFHDTFLFTAHASPIRTLTVSPASDKSTKHVLATSSADERINLYTLSSTLSAVPHTASVSARNRHLGTLHHHANTPTALLFTPTRTKFLTAGLDGQIHILRARDWSPLSVLKAPKPKPKPINHTLDYGEGYGPRIATFGDDGGTGGVLGLALHPSQKILLSIAQGERTVRLWNLMTGRKAGALQLEVPRRLGNQPERIEWAGDGTEFAVAFERGVVVYGMDAQVQCRIATTPPSKVHHMRYVALPRGLLGGAPPPPSPPPTDDDDDKKADDATATEELLAISTEDGRILFYSTATPINKPDAPTLRGTLGGRALGLPGRIKDFAVLTGRDGRVFVVAAGSDGVVKLWLLSGHGSGVEVEADDEARTVQETTPPPPSAKKAKKSSSNDGDTEMGGVPLPQEKQKKEKQKQKQKQKWDATKQAGRLIGLYETGRRITCLAALVMEVGEEKEVEKEEVSGEDNSSSDDSD